MVDAMKVKGSIYFATLQEYVIFETELYTFVHTVKSEQSIHICALFECMRCILQVKKYRKLFAHLCCTLSAQRVIL